MNIVYEQKDGDGTKLVNRKWKEIGRSSLGKALDNINAEEVRANPGDKWTSFGAVTLRDGLALEAKTMPSSN